MKCFRTFHKTCIDIQNFGVSSCFKCSDISKLFDNNIATTGTSCAKLNIRDKCLVCGLSCDHPNKISCSNECGFGAHRRCIDILNNFSLCNIDFSEFKCNDISVQLKFSDIEILLNSTKTSPTTSRIISKNKVQIQKYNKRQRRYTNDLTTCKACGQTYDLDETEHILSSCPGLSSTPIKIIKRSKLLLNNKSYLKRLTEYSKFESHNFLTD